MKFEDTSHVMQQSLVRGWNLGARVNWKVTGHVEFSRHKNGLLFLCALEKLPGENLPTILHLQVWMVCSSLFPIRESLCSSWQSLSNTRPRGFSTQPGGSAGRAPCLVNTSVPIKDPCLIIRACQHVFVSLSGEI